MYKLLTRATCVSALALGAVGFTALAAGAAGLVGSAVTAKSSANQVRPGQSFTISGHLAHGTTALANQNVELLARAAPTQKWDKATNTPAATAVTDAKGNVQFAVTGLKHGEQYMLYHPSQTVSANTYGASESRIVTILRATS
jgi:hypothetical protein